MERTAVAAFLGNTASNTSIAPPSSHRVDDNERALARNSEEVTGPPPHPHTIALCVYCSFVPPQVLLEKAELGLLAKT